MTRDSLGRTVYPGRTAYSKARFEERLTKELASGRLREPRERLAHAPPRKPRHFLRWATGVSAASATAFLLVGFNQPPRWTALPGAGSGNLVVDGNALSVDDTDGLTSRIRPGSHIRLDSTEDLNLVSSGLLVLQLTPGTEMILPKAPGRWIGRGARTDVQSGLLRVTTGRHFRGASLTVNTPEATVRAEGTTFAVIAGPGAACVCVLDGSAKVDRDGEEKTTVPAGSQWEIRGDAKTPLTGEMGVAERAKLIDLRDRMRAVMD